MERRHSASEVPVFRRVGIGGYVAVAIMIASRRKWGLGHRVRTRNERTNRARMKRDADLDAVPTRDGRFPPNIPSRRRTEPAKSFTGHLILPPLATLPVGTLREWCRTDSEDIQLSRQHASNFTASRNSEAQVLVFVKRFLSVAADGGCVCWQPNPLFAPYIINEKVALDSQAG